tara:strand:- start:821 stop:1183 length:363 start_codon:yes stop_codon:yes gene_type:complete
MNKNTTSDITEWLIWSIFLLSIADMTFTIVEIKLGLAYEMNPWLAFLHSTHPSLFIFAKVLLTAICCSIFLCTKDNILTKMSVIFIFIIYLMLLFFHIIGIIDSTSLLGDINILNFATHH